MNKILFSNKTDDWYTPKEIYKIFMERGFFDPCPLGGKEALSEFWDKPAFVNPPDSKIEEFVDHYIASWRFYGKSAWFLLPARTDTKWFKKLYGYAHTIVFITGRLKFGGSDNPAPFPNLLIYCQYKERGGVETDIVPKYILCNKVEYYLDKLKMD